MADPALDRMTEIVRSLVSIMRAGNLPAVDLADLRAVLGDAGRADSGVGAAEGPDRARKAAALAVLDLHRTKQTD